MAISEITTFFRTVRQRASKRESERVCVCVTERECLCERRHETEKEREREMDVRDFFESNLNFIVCETFEDPMVA